MTVACEDDSLAFIRFWIKFVPLVGAQSFLQRRSITQAYSSSVVREVRIGQVGLALAPSPLASIDPCLQDAEQPDLLRVSGCPDVPQIVPTQTLRARFLDGRAPGLRIHVPNRLSPVTAQAV